MSNTDLVTVLRRRLDVLSDLLLNLVVQLASGGLERDLVLVERDLGETDEGLAGRVDHVLGAMKEKKVRRRRRKRRETDAPTKGGGEDDGLWETESVSSEWNEVRMERTLSKSAAASPPFPTCCRHTSGSSSGLHMRRKWIIAPTMSVVVRQYRSERREGVGKETHGLPQR